MGFFKDKHLGENACLKMMGAKGGLYLPHKLIHGGQPPLFVEKMVKARWTVDHHSCWVLKWTNQETLQGFKLPPTLSWTMVQMCCNLFFDLVMCILLTQWFGYVHPHHKGTNDETHTWIPNFPINTKVGEPKPPSDKRPLTNKVASCGEYHSSIYIIS